VEQGTKARWTLDKAFPVKWVGPSFKSDEAAVAIESLELAHHGIQTDWERIRNVGTNILSRLFSSL
jgi:phage tail-like protein